MTFYVTTPIYYVNSKPHIGHAYTTIAADILTRHHRQRGEETFFLTGVDEHATKVWRVAEEQGLPAQEYVDQIAVVWRDLPQRLNAETSFFIRTSDAGHKEFVRDFLQRIYDNGDVYEDVYAGLYCVGCEAFKTEDELVDGKCPDHDTVPEWIEEKNYFFRLSKYQDQLLELYESRPDYVQPAFRFNEVKSFVSGGLRDFSISRAGQPWGIPLPWDESQVAYVWADALVNYLSALTYARPGEDLRDTFWPEVRHVMAQDIIRFHCVYWPAMLLAAGYDVPKQLFIHGYLTLDDRKISKSRGNSLDPLDVIDVYGVDPLRFWCARAVPFGQDGNASLAGIAERYESELGNDLGNLLSRTTAMVVKYREGRLPGRPGRLVGDRGRDRGRAAGERRDRQVRHHRCARAHLVARPRAQPARDRDEAVGAREGRGERGAARPGALRPLRRPAGSGGRALRVSARDRAEDPGRPRPAAGARLGAGRVREARRGRSDRGGTAALPAHRAAGRRRGVTAAP